MPKGRIEKLFLKGFLWVVIVALLALSVFLFGSAWGVYQKERTARLEKDVAVAQNQDLLKRKEALEESLASLSTERGIEQEIRERFPVVKDGEEVIVLIDAEDPAVEETREESGGLWGSLINWFGF